MPRTSEQNTAIRNKRITQIVQTAREIYLEKGVRGMEIGDVAERSGLGRGTIYHYYKNKFELLQQVFKEIMENSKRVVEETLNKEGEPIQRLEQYFRKQLSITAQSPLLFKFFKNIFEDVELVYGERSNEILYNFQDNLYKPVIDTFKEAMDKGQIISMEPEKLSNILWGALIGASTTFIQNKDRSDRSIEEVIISILFNGMRLK